MRDEATARRRAPLERLEDRLDAAIEEASAWLLGRQHADGYWAFELEADASIPSEYILLNHFLGRPDDSTERKLAAYLRRTQGRHGGWPLFHDGDFDLSATVKAYFALKLVGDAPDALHMRRAREAVLAHGGAERSNVFTRYTLALFGQVPWRAVPLMRVEAMLLPRWFPFHIDKVSYWSRTVMVPLFVLAALRPRARNPRGVGIRELFTADPEGVRRYLTNPTGRWPGRVFLLLDRLGRALEPLFPKALERRAIAAAVAFVRERLNGEDGLGAIFPAMANTVMMFDALGYAPDHREVRVARRAVDRLLALADGTGYCQPCVSPVWDTGLALHALLEAGMAGSAPAAQAAGRWLRERQILTVKGDWAQNRRHVRPGGWAFQYRNDHYPDVDDAAVVVMALHRAAEGRSDLAIERGAEWVIGMQCRNGGWASFDADNEYDLLQHIPFADHGALLDPPTADVSARCLGMLAQLGYDRSHPAVTRAIAFLRREQEDDGSWFGRWGTNYIYGTWSALCALNAIGEDARAPYVRKAAEWLKSRQRDDGGWGEDCATYWRERRGEAKASTPSQTAWAVLGLMAAGEVESDSVGRGIEYLLRAPRRGGKWDEEHFNAVGFPRVFYLHYHGYSAYFPLWALARYRNLREGNRKTPSFGL